MNRVVSFLLLALVVFFIITQPTDAAHTVQTIAGTLRDAAKSVTVFFAELV
jgi:large-conductance mechanosensitive channel